MQFFHQSPFVTPLASATVATIGNFDGMHRGHQAILNALITVGQKTGLATTVILFEPQPAEYFKGAAAPARLMCLREKLVFLQQAGIDQVVCLRFDAALAALPAERFISDILIGQLQIQHLWVGDDFRFGYQRQGDFALLAKHLPRLEVLPTFALAQERVSSSLIRSALAAGDFALASQLLGRPFSITALVIAGRQLGRTLAFPTLNMVLHRRVVPFRGVYAVYVYRGQQRYLGVANIGCRPTVGGEQILLETHLLATDEDLYGQRLRVEFCCKLRAESKFASLEALKAQIALDCAMAQQFFDANEAKKVGN